MNTTNQSFKYPIVAMAAAVATVGALAGRFVAKLSNG